MITSSLFLVFIASFVLYNTSKKAVLSSNTAIEIWLQQHINYAKIIGSLFLIAALVVSIYSFGTTSGILFWLIALMTILGLMIIIYPLQKVNYKHMLILILVALLFEYTL